MDKKSYFYFDIETSRKYESYDEFKEADERGAKLFEKKVLKKLTKEEWDTLVIDKFARNKFVRDEYVDLGGLLPEYGRVVCMAYGFYKPDGGNRVLGCAFDLDEKKLIGDIAKAFNQVSSLRLIPCGYNVRGFDIPYIYKKCLSYGIPVPSVINSFGKKPWEVLMFDMMDTWKGTSNSSATFDEMAYSLGVESPKKDMNGSEVGDAFFSGQYKEIVEYCKRDVACLMDCSEKIENLI